MKERVLALLAAREGEYISGEAMSAKLGVSRAAVWKAIEALRSEGCQIESAPRRGYRLAAAGDRLTEGSIRPYLRSSARLICLETVDSTNNYAKSLAISGWDGAPAAIVADEQTGGRGRQGRTFLSPPGMGIYVTLLLRPDVSPARAVALTSCAAVAVCDGVEAAAGVRPEIKWPNDVLLNGRKLCGILTEMALEGETGALQYVAVGIGVNVRQTREDFPPALRESATSLLRELGRAPARGKLCAAVADALLAIVSAWERGDETYKRRYRDGCVTLGRPVRLMRAGGVEDGFAEALDDDLALLVRFPDGHREAVTAGEVSVRGPEGQM